ncbi:MAG: acetolactate synthase large subunit, partial [Sciscionella sp.]
AVARAVSGWVASPETATELVDTCTEAVAAACAEPGGPATIILPADVSWSQGAQVGEPAPASAPSVPDAAGIEAAAAVLRSGEPTVLLLGGKALRERGLRAANRVAAVTGVRVLAETFPARLQRGAGLPAIDRLGYLAEAVLEQLRGVTQLMLAGTKAPVSFFAYPDKPSELTPQDASVHTLVADGFDATAHLEALAELLAPYTAPVLTELARPELPTGELTAQSFSAVIGALLPERAIISDEANTSGFLLPSNTAGAPRHDVLTLTGGAIGQGLAVALGAAIAAPDRPVLCLEADGSFMYGPSALWTMVREHLDITTVVLSNRAYAILRLELQRVGAQGDGPKAKELLDLSTPALDFVALATGMGMPASRARTAENFAEQLRSAFATPGPHLIEAVIPPLL